MNIPGQAKMREMSKRHASLFPMQDRNVAILRDVNGETSARSMDVVNGKVDPALGFMLDYAALSAAAYRSESAVIAEAPALRPVFERWTSVDIDDFQPDQHKPGWTLRIGRADFTVWKSKERDEVIISFRGTDFKQATDWFSNLRWVTRFIPRTWDQYEQVQAWIDKLIETIHRTHPSAEIITTGHSLGGGLAQQALYATPTIKCAFTFHASMVTGYYAIRPKSRRLANAKGGQIYRIFEHGEILAYLRWVMKKLYNPFQGEPKITEVRFNLLGRRDGHNSVGQHNIIEFAKELATFQQDPPGNEPAGDDRLVA